MMAIVAELGDDQANAPVGLPGANTAYQLVFHCCGMLEWWTREAMLGVDVGRDRGAEFEARGELSQLRARVEQVKAQLREDLSRIDRDAPLRGDVRDYAATPIAGSARGA